MRTQTAVKKRAMPLDIVKLEPKGESFSFRLPLSLDRWVRDEAKKRGCRPAQILEACVKSTKEAEDKASSR